VVPQALACAALLSIAGCERGAHASYEPQVKISRLSVVRRDAATGGAVTIDVELSFVHCPGEQLEVVRGGAEFAECIARYRAGDEVPIRLVTRPSKDGHLAHDVTMIGGCARPPDPADEGSFLTAQECVDVNVHGARVGFRCDRVPRRHLTKLCPWFAR